jgi:hypothetical protein
MKAHVKLFKSFLTFFITINLFCFSFISGYAQAIEVNSAGDVGINTFPMSHTSLRIGDGDRDKAIDCYGDADFNDHVYMGYTVSITQVLSQC